MEPKTKKSFVTTGVIHRFQCNCGCVDHNSFRPDRGYGGHTFLFNFDRRIDKYADTLREAGDGQAFVKVTVTVERLTEAQHKLLNKESFTGEELRPEHPNSLEAQRALLAPSMPDDDVS